MGVKAGGGLRQGLHWCLTSEEETGPGDLGWASVHEGVRLHVNRHSEVDHLLTFLTVPYSKVPFKESIHQKNVFF